MNGLVSQTVSAFTAEKVTQDMKDIEWSKQLNAYKHLKALDFPDPDPRSIFDLPIGIDSPDLHFSFRKIKGKPGEPLERLTPLGWACIGSPNQKHESKTNYFTFHKKRKRQ